MSLTSSMNIAQEALSVAQAAITVVSNNIANVDTPGYSKLRADQATVVNVFKKAGDSAVLEAESLSGVTLAAVTRYSNTCMESYYWDESSTGSYLSQYSSIASNIQDLVNELHDTGLSKALSDFYTAANSLSNTPGDYTARQNYVSKAQNVCAIFNTMSSNLTGIQKNLVGTAATTESSEIATQVGEVNNLLDQLATVNESIIKTNNGTTSAASLLDQRDTLVAKMALLMPVKTTENPNGTMDVSLGSNKLVDGLNVIGHLNVANSIVSGNITTTVSIINPENPSITLVSDVNSQLTGGSIGAILDSCGTGSTKLTISGVLKSVDAMASEFATVLNAIQTQVDYHGTTGTPMCIDKTTLKLTTSGATNYLLVNSATNTSAGITAANISVNSAVTTDPYLVAAARVNTVTNPTYQNDTGNNSNMTLVKNARTDASYYTNLGGTTIESYLAAEVADVGSDVENIDTKLKTQTLVQKEIQTKLTAATGVNLDEELADMIKYQQAYQAAARVFSTCNDLLDTLVNLGK